MSGQMEANKQTVVTTQNGDLEQLGPSLASATRACAGKLGPTAQIAARVNGACGDKHASNSERPDNIPDDVPWPPTYS